MSRYEMFQLRRWRPQGVAFGALCITLALHLMVIGRVDLSVDEAHYALYGLFPDWSYFDHPPLVGWLQAVILRFSESEFALRLWPLLLVGIATWLVYRLTIELFPLASPWTPAIAVLLLHSMVVFQLLGIALVPELPLLVFGLAATLFLWRASVRGRMRDWLLFGLCLGLAGLSKYTAVTLPLGAVLFLLWQNGWRGLFQPGLWLAGLVAIFLVLPVFYWNAQHEWISFKYQLGHGLPERAWSVQRFATAVAGQLLAYGPLVVVAGLLAPVAVLRRITPAHRLTLAMVLPLFLLIFWGAGFEETLPHWTLMGWVLLAPLSACWLNENVHRKWLRRTAWVGGGYALLLGVLLHGLLFWPGIPFKPYQHPLTDLLGWREAAARAVELQQSHPGAVIHVGNWVAASRIAWYARPARVRVADSRYDQFDIWYGEPNRNDQALLIVPDYLENREHLNGMGRFTHCRLLDEFVYRLNQTPVHRFSYYFCTGYHG